MATEQPKLEAGALPVKMILEYYRCEMHGTCHFWASDEALRYIQRTFAGAGVELVVRELKKGEFPPDQAHRVREVFAAVHEVQGLKWEEGCSPIGAIESLVAKYAELK